MIYAFVLAEDGTRLMPTDIRHARRLLKKKEAVIAGHKAIHDPAYKAVGTPCTARGMLFRYWPGTYRRQYQVREARVCA